MPRASLAAVLACVLLGLFPACVTNAQGGLEAAKPWLGVAIEAGKDGVLIKGLIAGAPAEEYGLKEGDEIVSVGEFKVRTPQQLVAAVQLQGVGNTVVIRYLRGGKEESRSVRLLARPDQLEVTRKQLVGKAAPAFDLPVVLGKEPGSTEKLKGRVVLVEFWATWCPACRDTHRRLSAFAKARPEVAVVAISDEDEATQKAYAAKTQPAFTLLRDVDNKTAPWMVPAIPMLAVLDKQGKVTFATIGAGSYLEEAIAAAEALLK